MAITEKGIAPRTESEKGETKLPSPEAMLVQKWFGAIDDVAIEFSETLAEQDGKSPEKAGYYLVRKFNGYEYRWSWTNTTRNDAGSYIDAEVELIFRPDHLLRGAEAFIGGFTQVAMIGPISGKTVTAGGPALLGLKASLNASSRTREKILGQIKDYLPQAREAGNRIAQELPAKARELMRG